MLDAIFVVGTGRSGTHFTCRALSGFENALDPLDGRENGSVLHSIANSALYHKDYPIDVIDYYHRRKNDALGSSIFVDQHHPNVFFVEDLSKIFSNPVFLYPLRPIVQVVASMLQHKGVLGWYDVAKRGFKRTNLIETIPVPNNFLGIEHRKQLFELELYKLCALRVLAHHQRMHLLTVSRAECRFISYEGLVNDQEEEFSRVLSDAEIAALGAFNLVEKSEAIGLEKYKTVLSSRQIDEIAELERTWNEGKALGAD